MCPRLVVKIGGCNGVWREGGARVDTSQVMTGEAHEPCTEDGIREHATCIVPDILIMQLVGVVDVIGLEHQGFRGEELPKP